jgi:hypothetical protein
MSDEPVRQGDENPERVNRAFDDLHERLGDRPTGEERERLARLRSAAASGDAAGLRDELTQVKERHGWIYEEMGRHPDFAALVNELALWGF